jgi:hypothetical protein
MAQFLDAEHSKNVNRELQSKTRSNTASDTEPPPENCPPPPIPLPKPSPAAKQAAEEIWPKVMDLVSNQMNAPSLRVWFEGTIPHSLVGEHLTLLVPNSFAKEYIEGRFKPLLEKALSSVSGGCEGSIIECHVDEGIAYHPRRG